jgi:hypothetical protein
VRGLRLLIKQTSDVASKVRQSGDAPLEVELLHVLTRALASHSPGRPARCARLLGPPRRRRGAQATVVQGARRAARRAEGRHCGCEGGLSPACCTAQTIPRRAARACALRPRRGGTDPTLCSQPPFPRPLHPPPHVCMPETGYTRAGTPRGDRTVACALQRYLVRAHFCVCMRPVAL